MRGLQVLIGIFPQIRSVRIAFIALVLMRFICTPVYALAQGKDPDYAKARIFQLQLRFDSAQVFYNRCRDRYAMDSSALMIIDKRIAECSFGNSAIRHPRNFVITNLGPAVNSPFEDYAPVISRAEDVLIFTSRRPDGNVSMKKDESGKYFEDVFIAQRKEGIWRSARNAGPPINTPYHDSDIALSADGSMLLLYGEQQEGDILISYKRNDRWTAPAALPFPVNTKYRESSACFSPDENSLYVASERPGGFGGLDIYKISQLQNGRWSDPINLGPVINTKWDEDSPFADYDDKTLYFSSSGHSSMGGFDIFKTTNLVKAWTEPENLGYPINTPGHDNYFISAPDGRRAYYSSSRAGGTGEDDIYEITLPEELRRVAPAPEEITDNSSPDKKMESLKLIVYFSPASSVLSGNQSARLADWWRQRSWTKGATIRVEGHADAIGGSYSNLRLSSERVDAVVKWLTDHGLPASAAEKKAWGEQKPAATNDDEREGRELNRRVEITIKNQN
ncbi:MAG: OmpA family protein [Bacteroidetes bacterium]|nr:OmpA family protein [Bacteroidota bacterium]